MLTSGYITALFLTCTVGDILIMTFNNTTNDPQPCSDIIISKTSFISNLGTSSNFILKDVSSRLCSALMSIQITFPNGSKIAFFHECSLNIPWLHDFCLYCSWSKAFILHFYTQNICDAGCNIIFDEKHSSTRVSSLNIEEHSLQHMLLCTCHDAQPMWFTNQVCHQCPHHKFHHYIHIPIIISPFQYLFFFKKSRKTT